MVVGTAPTACIGNGTTVIPMIAVTVTITVPIITRQSDRDVVGMKNGEKRAGSPENTVCGGKHQ